MAPHTPGPWTFYDDSNDGKTGRIEICATGKTVARIYHSVPAEDLPNAYLIAAAPALLKAARIAVTALAHITQSSPHDEAFYGPAYRALDEAIAKATGSAA